MSSKVPMEIPKQQPALSETAARWTLESPGQDGARVIDKVNNKVYTVNTSLVGGPIEGFTIEGQNAVIGGWAVGRSGQMPPVGFVVFMGKNCVGFAEPVNRPDVAHYLKNQAATKSGLHVKIPLEKLKDKPFSDFRAFALTEGGLAGELNTLKVRQEGNEKILFKD